MMIGTFADIVFQVSDSTYQTLEQDSLEWDCKAKYATHERHNGEDLPEKVGVELQTISFDMILSYFYGVQPLQMWAKIKKAIRRGTVSNLILGQRLYGEVGTKWTAIEAKFKSKQFGGSGALLSATISITLQAYPKE